ncbi:MAG: transcription termination factor Rho [Lachnospiraceae bacterium]|nr:transcription termination factor Rho [Lachnospiraceae bacterium]
MKDYLEMTITQLKDEAKNRGLKGISAMKKQELAELLANTDKMLAQKKAEASVGKTEKAPVAAEKVRDGSERPAQPRPQGAGERQLQSRPQGTGERPMQSRPQGTGERPMQSRPQGMGERPMQSRPQGMGERPMQSRPQGMGERPVQPRPQGTGERPMQTRPQGTGERPVTHTQSSQEHPTDGMKAALSENMQETASPQMHRFDPEKASPEDIKRMDSGETRTGILEVMTDNFGFIRCDNYLPGENDVYVSPAQIRKYGLKTGDIICGNTKIRMQNEKFSALLYIKNVNGLPLEVIMKRKRFEDLTPIFPNERIHLETPGCSLSMRMVDLISPIGKGQRGMIVSQPKTGKTTLLKQIAKAITKNHPDMNMIILLIDERPEEVTDIKESIEGDKVEVIYSTFDELPENHKRVSEMVIERAKRLVEQKQDVVILLDSITRLARAYNLTVAPSGRTLSGGLDPAALHMPKKFFGAARNMREGGSLTSLATALVDTGSRMDDVVFEEFKGTGNMELQLDRNLSERRVFPAIDLPRSSTRRDDLLLTAEEQEATSLMRRLFNGAKAEESIENIMRTFQSTKNNAEFVQMIKKYR